MRIPLLAAAVLGVAGLAAPAAVAAPALAPDEGALVTEGDVVPLTDASRSDRVFAQLGLGASIFDARRDVFLARWSPSLSAGWRFDDVDVFALVEFDQSFDFSIETDRLDVLNYGVGFGHTWFVGHLRSSLALGGSTLLSATEIDEAGTTGWFVDLRPLSARWPFGDALALELTPLAFDVLVPEPVGVPLIIYAYTTTLAIEWAGP